MKKLLSKNGFDELDRAILEELQQNGRISNADLARKIHLSQPAVHNRIKRLEKRGIIQQYTALLDRDSVGYPLLGFVYLSLDNHAEECWQGVANAIERIPEVLECYQLTGDDDAMLKIIAQHTTELEQTVREKIMTIPGVSRVKTQIAIRQMKSTTALGLE